MWSDICSINGDGDDDRQKYDLGEIHFDGSLSEMKGKFIVWINEKTLLYVKKSILLWKDNIEYYIDYELSVCLKIIAIISHQFHY